MNEFQGGRISGPVEEFLATCERSWRASAREETLTKIYVPTAASSLTLLYEKVRNVIAYKQEHLLRRNAIERFLTRRFFNGSDAEIAKTLVKELIWARYLKNDFVPEVKIVALAAIMSKYRLFLAESPKNYQGFIFSLASVEMERALVSPGEREALIKLMYQVLPNKDTQTFLAIGRSLTKLDRENLSFLLFFGHFQFWGEATRDQIIQVARQVDQIKKKIDDQLNSPRADWYFRKAKKYTAPFLALSDIVFQTKEQAKQILEDPVLFESYLRSTWAKRFTAAKTKFRREANRSILFIFVTKMTLALILELPFDLFFSHQVKLLPLTANIVFPPLLMFLVVATIRLPGRENTERLVELVKEIVKNGKILQVEFSLPVAKKMGLKDYFFQGVLGTSFILSFAAIGWLLFSLKFNLVSAGIFVFFLSVIMFFGFLIRESAQELVVIKEKEGIGNSLIDFISLPFLQLGKKLSRELGKINIFTFLFDVIIETPVKSLVQIIEDWITFIKKQKEETVTNLPT